ncbi:sigma-54-dependent Fis family transcriptional regulator [Variovorax ginsengisoli]|uniref:Sigma-54-dependent Fis family transcriptional regulator n=1 Tax=Variovorax ginsengisoli TaxID=363844 RepID=A0ABT8SFE2_9BURK|nr:sigma-54-dependent Fis family transcriptional regulator [Variovorax ginsengisoli]MDN8618295.1 sigma-54-dependent Fis family transcriptional regulator [Variovorax ginsengisoli]MDO1537465.1 sigma-54-dependent Fis family transcriptional regulator [Variovorax ginsengisoli]
MVDTHRALATSARTWTTPAVLPVPQQPARTELIEQWHQRCSALGLTRIERPDFEPLTRCDLTVARERNQRLFTHAAPVMEMLFEQIVNTESMIVLADVTGTILHSVGDDRFLQRADKVALTPGVNWAEHSKGTNAIGTALFEETPTVVHGGEHFIHANHFLTCSAAPIFDPRGNMLGVLDVTGDQRSYHQHTMGLVRMSARMIENQWLSDDYGNRLRLHFHSRVEFIGTLLEGIIVVGADGKILGANRSALDQLDMSSAALRMHSLTSLFGTTASAVFDHFRTPLPVPMTLSLAGGREFHVNARFNGPQRSMVMEPGFSQAAAEVVDHRAAAGNSSRRSGALAGDTANSADGTLFSGLHYLNTGDPQIGALVQKVQRVINRDIPLLILGETGTGKELLARAVHQDSNRAKQPFVAVNCASIPESLIEAELFGYEDGAFTGARRKGAVGRIVQANGGTLFLDEIGDMPLPLQARLLRVLQERNVTPLGSLKSIPVDIAVIGATHRKLRDMIEAGSFREDLYYRLNGLVVKLPALRERCDLDVVARRILLAECPHGTPDISAPVMSLFKAYAWPGNVRQLANVLRTASVMAAGEGQIAEHHLSDDFLEDVRCLRQGREPAAPVAMPAAPPAAYAVPVHSPALPQGRAAEPIIAPARPAAMAEVAAPRTLSEAEVELIRNALAAANGNISVASKQLGISRNTIYRKLRWAK